MKTSEKIATAASVALVAGAFAVLGVSFASAGTAPAPTQTAVVAIDPAPLVTETPTPTPTVDPTPTQAPVVAPAPAPAPGPDLCPSGTQSNSSDGTNDLTCLPDVCYTIRGIPDPAHPECDVAEPPSYYR